jgi:hypothetical protein
MPPDDSRQSTLVSIICLHKPLLSIRPVEKTNGHHRFGWLSGLKLGWIILVSFFFFFAPAGPIQSASPCIRGPLEETVV